MGDSTTAGIGDRTPSGWRGWARLLAGALATTYDVSFCNLAVSGATARDVCERQLPAPLTHRPDLASLIVGVNRHDVLHVGHRPDPRGPARRGPFPA